MDEWRHQFNNPILTKSYKGEPDVLQLYKGEARKLIYELKNLMRFQNLKQLKMTRHFVDGTVITAWSIYGQDFINIDTSGRLMEFMGAPDLFCSITLIDVPDVVQPMRYPGRIDKDEVEGTDYIKTYYTVNLKNCSTCSEDVEWSLCSSCKPFIYNPELQLNPDERLSANPKTDDMCLHTLDGCSAKIISSGEDSGGKYIIWKAFTESAGIFSRTGFGYMLLEAVIKNKDTQNRVVCYANEVVKVDCCKKDPAIRNVEIWWRGYPIGSCSPFLFYFDEKLCLAPKKTPDLRNYAYAHMNRGAPLFAIPELKGGCIPFRWSFSGKGRLVVPDYGTDGETGKMADYYAAPSYSCDDFEVITLTDRCGNEYQVRSLSCCDQAEAPAINLTSYVMGCSAEQDLTVTKGCGPYVWSLSGGGSLAVIDENTVKYTAPASNPNCTLNATVTVRDCCGRSDQVQIAVNCYTADYVLKWGQQYIVCCWKIQNPSCAGMTYDSWRSLAYWKLKAWSCSGALQVDCTYGYECPCPSDSACRWGYILGNCVNFCACDKVDPSECTAIYGTTCDVSCGGITGPAQCGSVYDARTQEQKDNGCCPINPFTGLPY